MFSTTIIYQGADGWLAEQVRTVVEQIEGCVFTRSSGGNGTQSCVGNGGSGMIIAHYDTVSSPVPSRLFAGDGNGDRSVPLVVVGAPDDPAIRTYYLRRGVIDCLSSPIDETRLAFLVDMLTVRPRCEGVEVEAEDPMKADDGLENIAGFLFGSGPMCQLLAQLRAVAPLGTTVLLTGETGTGKTHMARVLHQLSPRRTKPLVVVHCGALPTTLFESEMFGHVRGAFTSADQDRKGRLAEAADGTLLLDEIDCVPLEAQAKLLCAVEDREFEPVGSPHSQPFRARLIVATNRSLEQEMAAGRFRNDLYYRLNVVGFSLLPLRHRREVIYPLVRRFLGEFALRDRHPAKKLSAAALAALEKFRIPDLGGI